MYLLAAVKYVQLFQRSKCMNIYSNSGLDGSVIEMNDTIGRQFICCVTSLVECYEMVLAVIMSVSENVWDEWNWTCSSYLHECYCGYKLVTAVHMWLNFTLSYSLYRMSRKSDTKQNVQSCILFNNKCKQTNKRKIKCIYRGRYIDHIMYPKRTGRSLLPHI